MPPRKRSTRQRIPSPSPQVTEDEDVDMDTSTMNADQDDQDDELGDEEQDEIDDEDDENDFEDPPAPPPSGRMGPLKIRLKLPTQQASSVSTDSTPGEEIPRQRRTGRALTRVESESNDEDDDSERQSKTPSRMTARQARMRGGDAETQLLSLDMEDGPYAKRKKVLTETEVALRREETARKRKNLSEKKLEDEKAETINRLLKKQSRPRGKRTTALNEDKIANEDEDEDELPPPPPPPIPTMYRWISTSRIPDRASQPPISVDAASDKSMSLSFSIPQCAFESLGFPSEVENLPVPSPQLPKAPQECDVPGCSNLRKYRLVTEFTRGACGMGHLRELQAQRATGSVMH